MLQMGVRVENTISKGHCVGFRYNYNAGMNVPIDFYDRPELYQSISECRYYIQ